MVFGEKFGIRKLIAVCRSSSGVSMRKSGCEMARHDLALETLHRYRFQRVCSCVCALYAVLRVLRDVSDFPVKIPDNFL